MNVERSSKTGEPEKNKRGMSIGSAGCLLAIFGFVAIFSPDIRLSYIVWSFAILCSIGSLLVAAGRPRRKRWFEQGVIGIALAVLGMVIMFDATYPPDFRTTIPPVNYAEVPLPEILYDFCQHAAKQGHNVSFALYQRELAAERVAFRTTRRTRLKKALRKLTEQAACSFEYDICAYGSVIIRGDIRIFREKDSFRFGEGRLMITGDGIRPEGDWRSDLQGEVQTGEEPANKGPKQEAPVNKRLPQ